MQEERNFNKQDFENIINSIDNVLEEKYKNDKTSISHCLNVLNIAQSTLPKSALKTVSFKDIKINKTLIFHNTNDYNQIPDSSPNDGIYHLINQPAVLYIHMNDLFNVLLTQYFSEISHFSPIRITFNLSVDASGENNNFRCCLESDMLNDILDYTNTDDYFSQKDALTFNQENKLSITNSYIGQEFKTYTIKEMSDLYPNLIDYSKLTEDELNEVFAVPKPESRLYNLMNLKQCYQYTARMNDSDSKTNPPHGKGIFTCKLCIAPGQGIFDETTKDQVTVNIEIVNSILAFNDKAYSNLNKKALYLDSMYKSLLIKDILKTPIIFAIDDLILNKYIMFKKYKMTNEIEQLKDLIKKRLEKKKQII